MTIKKSHRMSATAASLLEGVEGRTIFEREYALHTFVVGIEEAMEAKGVSKADLARLLRKKDQAISRALKGKQNLTVGTLIEMAVALGKTVDLSVVELPKIQVVAKSKAAMSYMVRTWTTSTHQVDTPALQCPPVQEATLSSQECLV